MKSDCILSALRNVDKFTCWALNIPFLMTALIVIHQLHVYAIIKEINWKLVDGPNVLPLVECQPALSTKSKFSVCTSVWYALWTRIDYIH